MFIDRDVLSFRGVGEIEKTLAVFLLAVPVR
jgi:hypothetical protein